MFKSDGGGGGGGGMTLEPEVAGADVVGAGGGGGEGGSICSRAFILTLKLLFALFPNPVVSGTGGGGGSRSSFDTEDAFKLAAEEFDTLLRLCLVLFCWFDVFTIAPICMCLGGLLLLPILVNC